MSAEFTVSFKDTNWYAAHRREVMQAVTGLCTFSLAVDRREFRLVGNEPRDSGSWSYDVRLLLEPEHIFLEISAHPKSIEADLYGFFGWIRAHTSICIHDEDGDPSNW